MNDPKRQEIKEKIAAGQARQEERERTLPERAGEKAIEAKDKFTDFAREHPVATVAGGLAIGILISGLFKRSPTRKLGTKAAGLAAIGAEMALAYAQQAMEAASEAGRAGAERAGDLGDSLGDSARGLRRDAIYLAGGASDNARIAARKASKRISRAVRSRTN